MDERELRVGALISGGGTNLQAIIDACNGGPVPARVVTVISNNSKAFGLERARNADIPAFHISSHQYPDPADLDNALADRLEEHGVDLVVLAGYMKKLGPAFLKRFHNRVINIHPGPLPEFGGKGFHGLNVHRAVLESGRKTSGPTVHLVDEEYDHGPVLDHIEVPVIEGDTPESLAERVLEQEHKLFPRVIEKIARREIKLEEL